MRIKVFSAALVVSVYVLRLYSCMPGDTGTDIAFGKQFKIEYDQKVRLEDGTEFKFLELHKDTRCPEDALCVFEGEAIIVVTLEREDQFGEVFELTIPGLVDRYSTRGHKPKEYGEYRFTLLQLDPYPFSDHSEPKHRYEATLIVEKWKEGEERE